MSQSVVYQYLSAGSFNVTVPSGYSNQVLVYAWGAGGGSGTGAAGGGGGYAAGVVTIDAGDSVVISVGGTGGSTVGTTPAGAGGGTGNNPIVDLSGGTGANGGDPEDNDAGGSGGGGGASAVFVNGVAMLVAGGGGGGGGLGEDWAGGATAGKPGGVTSVAYTAPRGQNGQRGGAGGTGGGGGGYPFGGASYSPPGDDAGGSPGGNGGQNYANATVTSSSLVAGSGINPGGTTNGYYPGKSRGKATFDGCVIIVFQKLFTAWIKQAGAWKQVTNAYIKTGNTAITVPTPTIATTNYTAWPTSASALNTYLDGILAGDPVSPSETAWYVINPALTNPTIWSGTPYYNKSVVVMQGGDEKITSGSAGATSLTSGSTTYNRGSLAYSTTITKTIPGVGTLSHTVSVYNFSTSVTTSPSTIVKTVSGGWKQIVRGWMKKDGVWRDISTPLTLESSRVATTPGTRARINIVIASNTSSYDLLSVLNGLGTYYPGYSDITLTINAGVTVDSDTAGGAALTVDGLTSGDTLIIVNNGTILGRGGSGGASGWLKTTTVGSGKNTTTSTSVQPAYPGGPGGTGLAITYVATLENNGNIYAGGGGGGGGGISYNGTGGGQGGGGAGYGPGANAGTATTGGAGAGNGGAGGTNGANGTAGTAGSTVTVVNSNGKGSSSVAGSAGGAGGIGGKAIAGYAKLTVTVTGNIVGPKA